MNLNTCSVSYKISRERRNSQGEVQLLSNFCVHEYNLELIVKTVHPWDLSHPPGILTEYVWGGAWEAEL